MVFPSAKSLSITFLLQRCSALLNEKSIFPPSVFSVKLSILNKKRLPANWWTAFQHYLYFIIILYYSF